MEFLASHTTPGVLAHSASIITMTESSKKPLKLFKMKGDDKYNDIWCTTRKLVGPELIYFLHQRLRFGPRRRWQIQIHFTWEKAAERTS